MTEIHETESVSPEGLVVHQRDDELLFKGTEPTRAHADDAGLDLRYDPDGESFVLQPGQRIKVPTGTTLALPPGTVGLVCPRSGLADRHGITVVNAPGVVDQSYRGDVGVVLLNTGDEPVTFDPGDRVAQLVVIRLAGFDVVETDVLPSSEGARGTAGFGSTGRQ